MKKAWAGLIVGIWVILFCTSVFADAGTAYREWRKQAVAENASAAITKLPASFGDEERALDAPPAPVELIEPRLVKLKSRYFLPGKLWAPEKFEGRIHVYVKLDRSNPRAKPKLLKKDGFAVKKIMRNSLYVVETDYEGLEILRKKSYVIGVEPILPEDKMAEQVYRGNYGDWAMTEQGEVLLTVSFFEGIDHGKAAEIVHAAGGTLVSEKMLYGNKAKVRIPLLKAKDLAQADGVRYISQVTPPIKPCSVNSGVVANAFWWTDYENHTYSGLFDSPYGYTGEGIKVGIVDEGEIYEHEKLDTVIIVEDTQLNKHATWVAGVVAADSFTYGVNYGRGVASGVSLYSYTFIGNGTNVNNFQDGLDTHGIHIFNNSWGYSAPGPDDFGDYRSEAEEWDEFVYDNYDEYLCLVKSAGNFWNGVVPAEGEDTYHCLPPLSTAKNCITVGAVEWSDIDDDGIVDIGDSEIFISVWPTLPGASSTGPTDDGRIKPDLTAMGTDVLTTSYLSGQDAYYAGFGGTSSTAPAVTGVAALVHEAYQDYYSDFPTVDIVKALLCNTAVDIGNAGPDFLYGWGVVNAKGAIDTIRNNVEGISGDGGYIASGIVEHNDDEAVFQIEIDENNNSSDMKVMLSWVDPEGDPAQQYALINNLDLTVIDPGGSETTTYYPWVMNCCINAHPEDEFDSGWTPHYPAENYSYTTGPLPDPVKTNDLDNIEQVLVEADEQNSLAQGIWTVKVSAASLSNNQLFAVVSNKGFKEVNFLNCKVWDIDAWVIPQRHIPDVTPTLRFGIYAKDGIDLKNGTNPPQYRYSKDGGNIWTSWYYLGSDGDCYADADCSDTLTGDTHTGATYIRINNVHFYQNSFTDNLIEIKVCGDAYVVEQYEIPIGPTMYVDPVSGHNIDGYGSKDNPCTSIEYALSKISGDEDHQCTIKLRGDTSSAGMVYGPVEMEEYIDIVGGFDENWNENDAYRSVIDANNTAYGILAASHCTIRGVTVKNAYLSQPPGKGIYINGKTKVVVDRCVVEENRYGIAVDDGSTITIKNCTIKYHTYPSVHLDNPEGAVIVSGCVFEQSRLRLLGCSPSIVNCLFYWGNYGNIAVCIEDGSAPTIMNCTIADNTGMGVYVAASEGAVPQLINSIVWGNGDDIYLASSGYDTITISYSNIEESGYWSDVNNNISVDPAFRDRNDEDYRISWDSPCQDVGCDTDAPAVDIEGKDRPWGGGVDMGAYEYHLAINGIAYHAGDSIDTVSLTWDDEGGDFTCDVFCADDPRPPWTQIDTGVTSPWVSGDVSDSTHCFYSIKFHED